MGTQPDISYHTLETGLRIVSRRLEASPVEICGIAVNAGSRDEHPDEHGLAHLVEHTIFKGTGRRLARHINTRMEAVGGELNAYTTKEETFLYSVFPAGNLTRAVDLIADLATDSRFPADEVEREREVVCDEIDSYLDTPSEAVFDDFEELAFAGSPLAHNILGTKESVMTLGGEDCRAFLERYYTPGRMVFFYQGRAPHTRVVETAERYFGLLTRPDTPVDRTAPAPAVRFDISRDIASHQAHTVIGARTPGLLSPRRHALDIVTNVLGGPGMNSLLNVALREKRGLVYSVDASTSMMTDSGLMTIYIGCDPGDTARCRRLTAGILGRLTREGLSPARLAAAKKQLLGQLTVASTGFENTALSMARGTLHRGQAMTPPEVARAITDVTAADIIETARMIAPENMSVLTLM